MCSAAMYVVLSVTYGGARAAPPPRAEVGAAAASCLVDHPVPPSPFQMGVDSTSVLDHAGPGLLLFCGGLYMYHRSLLARRPPRMTGQVPGDAGKLFCWHSPYLLDTFVRLGIGLAILIREVKGRRGYREAAGWAFGGSWGGRGERERE